MNKLAVMVMALGAVLMVTGQVFGLRISPGVDPNFSSDTFLVEVYRGYEIWRDPARAGIGEYIIYTPENVQPAISTIKFELPAARQTIDYTITSSEVKYTTDAKVTDIQHKLIMGSGSGGSISPVGDLSYKEGVTVSISRSADDGYVFDYMTVDGSRISGVKTAVIVDGDHEIWVYWKPEPVVTETDIDDVQTQVDEVYVPEKEQRQTYFVRGTGLGLMGLGLVLWMRGKDAF